jgi:CheY-like chemotaxis protein
MGARVVFVEDEAAVQRLVSFWLEDAGYEVLLAGDGREGLELIRRERPDLVITDALMPEMTGDELVEVMTTDPELAAIPIVMATAAASPLRTQRMLERGCRAVLAKPLDEDSFLDAVRDALEPRLRSPG